MQCKDLLVNVPRNAFACSSMLWSIVVGPLSFGPLHQMGESLNQSAGCPVESLPLRISNDSVGRMTALQPIGTLRRLCPMTKDTSLSIVAANGRSLRYPGLNISHDGVTILALQYMDSVLHSDRPVDGWIISGNGGIIVGGTRPLDMSWSEMYAFYGLAQVSVGNDVTVRFCSLPNMVFTLNVEPTAVRKVGDHVDLRSIPQNAHFHHVFVVGGSLSNAFRPCR